MRSITIAAFLAACSPSVDPKVEEAVAGLEKFAAEARAGDCASLKSAFEAAHAAEGLKLVEAGSPVEARVKAADEKVKPLLDGCAAIEAAAAVAAPPAVDPAAPVAAPPAVDPAAPAPAELPAVQE
jgi:hypothetical protein